MRLPSLFALLLLAAASAAHATDFDFEAGVRYFGPDHESWPQVGGAVRFGPDRWIVKPVFGVAGALDPYGATIGEARLGAGGDFPPFGHVVLSWGAGFASLHYDVGANVGDADGHYAELAARWLRTDGVDFGVSVRFVNGPDIVFHYPGDELGGAEPYHQSISTVEISYLMRW